MHALHDHLNERRRDHVRNEPLAYGFADNGEIIGAKIALEVVTVLRIGRRGAFAETVDPRRTFWIMVIELVVGRLEHLERHDLEVALLETLDDLADKPLAHAVGLDDDEGLFFFWVCGHKYASTLQRSLFFCKLPFVSIILL